MLLLMSLPTLYHQPLYKFRPHYGFPELYLLLMFPDHLYHRLLYNNHSPNSRRRAAMNRGPLLSEIALQPTSTPISLPSTCA